MTVRKIPSHLKQETKIHEIIQKGGSPSRISTQANEPYRLSLRIPPLLKLQIDQSIALDPAQPSLTFWILEAIKYKLKYEKQNELI